MITPEDLELCGYVRQEPVNVEPPVNRGSQYPLTWHLDARGSLMELWRRSWPSPYTAESSYVERHPGHIAQAYISTTRPGVVKGWHLHAEQEDRFVVVRGSVLVCTFDLRGSSGDLQRPLGDLQDRKVQETVLDCQRGPRVLCIPPGVAHGWMALKHQDGESWVLNLCSREYDGTDEYRRPAMDGPIAGVSYDWRMNRDG